MSRGRRVLVVHPDMNASGGGNVVAAYTIEALKGGNEVTVLSWAPADLGALNRFYGTSLSSSELEIRSAPLPLRVLARLQMWVILAANIVLCILMHNTTLAEERFCLERYGQVYRGYMEKVPRYFLFF